MIFILFLIVFAIGAWAGFDFGVKAGAEAKRIQCEALLRELYRDTHGGKEMP